MRCDPCQHCADHGTSTHTRYCFLAVPLHRAARRTTHAPSPSDRAECICAWSLREQHVTSRFARIRLPTFESAKAAVRETAAMSPSLIVKSRMNVSRLANQARIACNRHHLHNLLYLERVTNFARSLSFDVRKFPRDGYLLDSGDHNL